MPLPRPACRRHSDVALCATLARHGAATGVARGARCAVGRATVEPGLGRHRRVLVTRRRAPAGGVEHARRGGRLGA